MYRSQLLERRSLPESVRDNLAGSTRFQPTNSGDFGPSIAIPVQKHRVHDAMAIHQSAEAGLILADAKDKKAKEVEQQMSRLLDLFQDPANQD